MSFSHFSLISALLLVVVQADTLGENDHYRGGEHDLRYDHEAFLGQEDAAKFEKLTPEQSKEGLLKLIPTLDSNNDGFISEQEMVVHINEVHRRFLENSVKTAWTHYKPEQITGGKLEWKVYEESFYGSAADIADLITDEQNKAMYQRDKQRWPVADLDKDGSLTMAEYTCFLHAEDCPRMHDVVVVQRTLEYDKNNDGLISMEEYANHLYRPEDYPELKGKEPDWLPAEREHFKEALDKNGDGSLDATEMKTWLFPPGYDHASAEAHHLLGEADDNKDDKLSTEEILKHYDVFVGSQTTDYGDLLKKTHDAAEL